MSDSTYPRTWFRVYRHGLNIEAREFVRETTSYLFWQGPFRERAEKKSTEYETWYATLEEAEAQVEANSARRDRIDHEDRVRRNAPAMLTLLQEVAAGSIDVSGTALIFGFPETKELQTKIDALLTLVGEPE